MGYRPQVLYPSLLVFTAVLEGRRWLLSRRRTLVFRAEYLAQAVW